MASSDPLDEAATQIIEVLNIDRHDHDMIVQALKVSSELDPCKVIMRLTHISFADEPWQCRNGYGSIF
jgi:hypothetical protein